MLIRLRPLHGHVSSTAHPRSSVQQSPSRITVKAGSKEVQEMTAMSARPPSVFPPWPELGNGLAHHGCGRWRMPNALTSSNHPRSGAREVMCRPSLSCRPRRIRHAEPGHVSPAPGRRPAGRRLVSCPRRTLHAAAGSGAPWEQASSGRVTNRLCIRGGCPCAACSSRSPCSPWS
jgi:hypothetical protein